MCHRLLAQNIQQTCIRTIKPVLCPGCCFVGLSQDIIRFSLSTYENSSSCTALLWLSKSAMTWWVVIQEVNFIDKKFWVLLRRDNNTGYPSQVKILGLECNLRSKVLALEGAAHQGNDVSRMSDPEGPCRISFLHGCAKGCITYPRHSKSVYPLNPVCQIGMIGS